MGTQITSDQVSDFAQAVAEVITSPIALRVLDPDKERLFALQSSVGLRIAVLGDSIDVGVGSSVTVSPYGECLNLIVTPPAAQFAYSLMFADPNFVQPREDFGQMLFAYVAASGDSTGFPLGTFPMSSWQTNKNFGEVIAANQREVNIVNRGQATVYYFQTTSDKAARISQKVISTINGSTITSQNVDTYTPAVTFGGVGAVPVGGRLRKATLGFTPDARAFISQFDTPTALDRGSGVNANAYTAIFGLTAGNGVDFMNFAVSSMTLLNASQANQDRGVTTTGQFNKAKAFLANVWMLGYGTNDSKTGVSTTSAFKTDYLARIDEIRAFDPKAVIILRTSPRGDIGSIYENNPVYNAVVREVAIEKTCSLIDEEYLFDRLPATAKNDEVHPSSEGYGCISKAMCAAFGIPHYQSYQKRARNAANQNINPVQKTLATPSSSFTGAYVDIDSITVNVRSTQKVIAQGIFNLARTSALDLASMRFRVTSYAGRDGTGAVVTGPSTVDSRVASAPTVNGTAVATISLYDERIPSDPAICSATYTLQGRDYQLRATDAISKWQVKVVSEEAP